MGHHERKNTDQRSLAVLVDFLVRIHQSTNTHATLSYRGCVDERKQKVLCKQYDSNITSISHTRTVNHNMPEIQILLFFFAMSNSRAVSNPRVLVCKFICNPCHSGVQAHRRIPDNCPDSTRRKKQSLKAVMQAGFLPLLPVTKLSFVKIHRDDLSFCPSYVGKSYT